MSRPPTDRASSFPGWVALASLGTALWLFFANAVPAHREQEELRALAEDLREIRQQVDGKIAETRLARGTNSHQDLQALLVAIDRLGFTPAELCAAYPLKTAAATVHDVEEPPVEPATEPPAVEPPAVAPPAGTPRDGTPDAPAPVAPASARRDPARAKFQ